MNRSRQFVFLCLFFVSGACGLIYEIVWSRLLVFVFGGTTFAITTVLGCFMGGLAVGSYLAGRLSRRVDRPARVYGLLEIGIGLYCLLVPFLLDLALPMYQVLAKVSGESFFWLTAGRVLVCAVILIIPTGFMGATLPLLSKAFVQRADEVGGAVARLYGINTIGAFVGCGSAGFFLLPAVGLSRSILLAALLNISAGLVALWMARKPAQQGRVSKPRQEGGADAGQFAPEYVPAIRSGVLLLLYGLSGVAAMAYQVAWTRALILAMGASTYAFSAIVACFILGIALGSLLVSPWISKIRSPLAWAGLLEALIGVSALVVVPLFGEMPGLVKRLCESAGATFERILAIEVLSVFGLLVVPTLCMGALLPLVCAIYEASRARSELSEPGAAGDARSPSAGQSVGAVYASNTLGTIIGASVTGFILIPWSLVGMQRTIVIASALSGIIATAFVLSAKAWRRSLVYGAMCLVWLGGVAFASVLQPWSKAVMVSGPYLGRHVDAAREVIFYREGVDTTVAVVSARDGVRSLLVNGKPDASDGLPDMRMQLLSAHIAFLIKPAAADVCVIGLGSGVTAGAALAHPVERVDVVEISSAVVAAAEYFSRDNNNVLGDPRAALHRADGRNFLLLGDRKYDIILSEPSNPWISGVANLFTREFFEIARRRLNPGGLHCQWIHAYSMKAEDFAAVIKTVSAVFRHVQLWDTNFDDYVILGSDEPIVIDVESMHFTFQRPAVSDMLSFLYINDPMQLAYFYIADDRQLASWTEAQAPLTDDLPQLEFSAPRYLLRSEPAVIAKALCDVDGIPTLAGRADSLLNREFLKSVKLGRKAKEYLTVARSGGPGSFQRILDCFLQMARHAPNDWRMFRRIDSQLKAWRRAAPLEARVKMDELYLEVARAASWTSRIRENRVGERAQLLWPLGKRLEAVSSPERDSMIEEAKALFDGGREEQALKTAKQAVRIFPDDLATLRLTGVWTLKAHGPEIAIPYLLKAWIMRRGDPQTNYHLARAYCLRGDQDRALAFLEAAITNGFEDRAAVESSDAFGGLRADVRFQQLLARISGAGDER